MSRFSDYLSSQITPQMTLLEKFNALIKFLEKNNYISIFYSSENYNPTKTNYDISKVSKLNYELKLGDCIVFSNGYYAFVETLGEETFTIGNILYFQGEQGVSVVSATINSSGNLILTLSDGNTVNAGNTGAVKDFIIDANQHLIVRYLNGTSNDLGAIFSGNISINGNLSYSGTLDGVVPIEKIKDTNNHARFIEGNLDLLSISGLSKTYGKWALSGTHLLIVLAFDALNEAVINSGAVLCYVQIPEWVNNKIYPTFGNNILMQEVRFYNEDLTHQDVNVYLRKVDNYLIMVCGQLTLNKDRSTRIQFDLLIDND